MKFSSSSSGAHQQILTSVPIWHK